MISEKLEYLCWLLQRMKIIQHKPFVSDIGVCVPKEYTHNKSIIGREFMDLNEAKCQEILRGPGSCVFQI